jgi:hypothetical protein
MTMRSWMRQLFARPLTRTIRKAPRRIRPSLEQLEVRLAPATYTWDGAHKLSISLGTSESLAVDTSTSPTFTLSGGTDTWTQSGGTATDGTNTGAVLIFAANADINSSLTINDAGAGSGTNDVTFTAGTTTSATINVDTTAQGGSITETSGALSVSGTLTTNSTSGTTLNGTGNAVQTYSGRNTTSGDISLTNNTAATLTLSGISETGGNITVNNTGGLVVGAGPGNGVNAGTGNVTLTATGGSLTGPATDGTADIVGGTVALTAKSGIGSATDAIETKASDLVTTVSDSGAFTKVADVGTVALNSVSAKTNAGNLTITFHGGGSLSFTASTQVLSASGTTTNVTFEATSGDIKVATVSAGTGNVTIKADGGNITPQSGGSGATLDITTSGGAISGATLVAGGSGYPANTTVNLAVSGGGGSGGIVAVTTDANGVATALAATPIVAGGTNYVDTSLATTFDTMSGVSGATVTLIATGSGNQIGTPPPVGGSATPLKVNSTLLNATTNNGFIVVANTTGNMALGTLNAGAALIDLTAVGAITDGTGSGSPNLTAADGAVLRTTGSNSAIGTSTLPIRTAIGDLTATTYDGGVYISDSDGPGMMIHSVLAHQGGSAPVLDASNQVVVYNSNHQPIVGTDNVSVTATGPILLIEGAAAGGPAVGAPNAVTLTSTAGSILEAIPNAGSDVLAQSVTLTANGSIGLSGGPIGLFVPTFSASTTNGSIFLSEAIPGTAVSVLAGGAGSSVSVTNTGAALTIGNITASGSVTLQETLGSLVTGTSTNVSGQTVNLTAKSGIGSKGSPFAVTAGDLSAAASAAGAGVYVSDTTAANSVSATTNAGDAMITYTGGSLNFSASTGLLSASGGATVSFDNTGGNVVLGAVKAASITASGAITADSTVDVTGGTLTLSAGTGIGVDPATGIGATATEIKTNVTTLNAATTTGDIYIGQSGALTLNAKSSGFSDSSTMTGSDISVSNTAGDLTVGVVSALGTVTLNAAGAVLAGSVIDVNVSAGSLVLTATNGIATSGAVLQTSVNSLTAQGGAGGGLFVANNQTLALTATVVTGGDVSISALGDLDLSSVTAPGRNVTLSATGALIDPSGPALNLTAKNATLTGFSIGGPSDALETQVSSSITATATDGALYISDLGTGSLTLTLTATGQGSDIDFTSAGSMVLNTVTAKGNTVTLTSTAPAGTVTTVLPQPTVNIAAQTLDIVATGGIGTSADPLNVLVAQVATADGGTPGVFMVNAGPLALTKAALEAPGSGTLTFEAASITILDMGGTTVPLASGRSLLLKTQTGPIVFLNPADTIRASGTGTITVEAGTVAGSGGEVVVGNLTTAGGNILVTADGSITIGLLNAGTGNVTVQSAHGIIIKGNGPSQLNVIAGTTTLSGTAPTARQFGLDEETKIAAAAGASAEAAAEQTSADAFTSQLPVIISAVTTGQATVASDQQTYNDAKLKVDIANGVLIGLQVTSIAAAAVKAVFDAALIPIDVVAAALQAIPIFGDGGGELDTEAVKIGKTVADIVKITADSAILAENQVLNVLRSAATKAQSKLIADQATLGLAEATQSAFKNSTQIAQAAAANALLQSETVAVVSTQAIAANDQRSVIGSPSNPIGIQVSGAVTVTAGPTDSYLQVAGSTAVNQINATGGVTLVSTGAISHGSGSGTDITATGLTISAANGIGTGTQSLVTQVPTLGATNTTGGDIDISNTAATPAGLNITGISNTGGGDVNISDHETVPLGQGITVTGQVSVTGSGTDNLTISSGSPLAISANVFSAGAIALAAAPDSPPFDNLTVNPGVTIQSGGSSVSLSAGNNVSVPSGSMIQASTTIAITGGKTSANVVVGGTLIASSATIGVDPATNNNNTFTITPSAATPMTVTGGTAAGTNTLNFNANGLAVTIAGNVITAAGCKPVKFSNFATVNIINGAGGGSVTLNATASVSDVLVLTGTGPGAGAFTLNGGPPTFSFNGVTSFAYNGSATTETITVSPYGTPLLPWGVATTINGGTGTATLAFNDVAGLSDNITIQASGPGAGQLVDSNAGTNASIAVVTYSHITNLVFNGSSGVGASDALTVNGTTGADTYTIAPTTASSATIIGAAVTITATGVGQIAYNGQGGNDSLTVPSPAATTVRLTPGAAVDSGTVQMGTAATLIPLSYSNLGTTGTLIVANTGGTRADTLVYNGTANTDVFAVDAQSAGGPGEVFLDNQIDVVTPGVSVLTLNGLVGDNTYSISAALGALPYTTINVNGRRDSTLNMSGAAGPVTVNLADNTPHSANPNTTITGYGGTVVLIGGDTVNLDTNGNSLAVNGTSRNDNITYTPTGASAGTVTNAGLSTVFNFTGDTSTFTISGQGGTADQVTVAVPAGRVSVREVNRVVTVLPVGSPAPLEPVTLAVDVQIVNLIGGGGPDTFGITPAAGLQYAIDGNLDNLVVNVSNTGGSSALVIESATGGPLPSTESVVLNHGQVPGSGIARTFTAGVQWPDINFTNIPAVSVNVAPSPPITGVSASESGTTVTITTPTPHGLPVGSSVTISGFTGAAAPYNGTWVITSVPTPTTFTYTDPVPGLPPATGGTVTPVAASAVDTAGPHINGVAISGQTGLSASGSQTPSGRTSLSASESGTTVTITTPTAHGLQAGTGVSIAGFTGVNNAAVPYNGTWVITSVPTPTTFTYTASNNNLPAATGGIEVPSPGQTGVSASESGTTVTITTPSAHGLQVGNTVSIGGFTGAAAGYNGTFVVAGVPTPTTFTYMAAAGLPSATAGSEVVIVTNVTIATPSAHGLQQGDSVTIGGFTGGAAGYNGTWVVTGSLTPTTFTYTDSATGLPASATGGSEVPVFSLFALKPQSFTQGPTPLINSLTISVVDPGQVGPDPFADVNPGLYTVVGDQTGIAPVSQVLVINNPVAPGQPATSTLQLFFAQPLLDDRYTLTISKNLVDQAGNLLAGTSNASEPIGPPTFPSGHDGLPADFVARFTVNSRPHIGVNGGAEAGSAQQQLDINGNGIWDPVNAKDAVNSDKAFAFGTSSDTLFSGNFAPAGQSGTGFNELGAYGQVGNQWRWLLTFNNVAQPDYSVVSNLQQNWQPVVGRFNPVINADEIGLFDGNGHWYIDFNHTNNVGGSSTVLVSDGLVGTAVVGDFDGSGHIEFATYQASKQLWTFDLTPFAATHTIVTLQWGFNDGDEANTPVVADMNGDGVTDIGLYVPPDSDGPATGNPTGWYWLVSQGTPVVGTINTLAHPFNPSPFSNDLYYTFGNGAESPLAGHWDPQLPSPAPISQPVTGAYKDVSVSAVLGSVPAGGFTGLTTRANANGTSEYWGGLTSIGRGTTYLAQIQRQVAGTWTTLASVPLSSFTPGSTLQFETIGTTLQLSLGGNVLATVADSAIRAAGSVGTYSTPGSVIEPAHATALTRTPAAGSVRDRMNLASGALLSTSWDQWAGAFAGSNGVAAGQAASNLATVYGMSKSNVSVRVNVLRLTAGASAGVAARYNTATGDMDFAQLVNRSGIGYVEIWRVRRGVRTRLSVTSLGRGVVGGLLQFDVAGTQLSVSVNGHVFGRVNDTVVLGAGTVGIIGSKGAGVDNFSAVPAPPAAGSVMNPANGALLSSSQRGAGGRQG